MTEAQCKALVATLAAAFPREVIDQATLNIYAQDLADLEFQTGGDAVAALRKSSRFFPTIGEIRERYAELRLAAPSPAVAWSQAAGHGERHRLVQRARRLSGDDYDWRATPAGVMHRRFLDAYADVLADAMLEITQPELAAARAAVGVRPRAELVAGPLPELREVPR